MLSTEEVEEDAEATEHHTLGGDGDREQRVVKVLLASAVGNILEWYDFALFGFMAIEIGENFFPEGDSRLRLMETFGIFAGAFFMRPLGGVLFGYLGDKLVGRKRALELSVMMMAFPTLALGCLPPYSMIGIAAPILLTLVRLVQGLAVGGQLTGSMIIVYENAPLHRRGWFGSFCVTTANGGTLAGSLVGSVMHAAVRQETLSRWAWRIPFLCSIFLAVVGLRYQHQLDDDFAPSANVKSGGRGQACGGSSIGDGNPSLAKEHPFPPLHLMYRFFKRQILTLSLLTLLWPVCFYTCFVWLATYEATMVRDPHPSSAFTINTASLAINGLLTPCFGWLVDKWGPRALIGAGALGLAVLSPPLFVWIYRAGSAESMLPQLVFAALAACYGSAYPSYMCSLFPPEMRYTAVANSFNIATVLGAATPVICTALAGVESHPELPGLYLSFAALVCLGALAATPAVVSRSLTTMAAFLANTKMGQYELTQLSCDDPPSDSDDGSRVSRAHPRWRGSEVVSALHRTSELTIHDGINEFCPSMGIMGVEEGEIEIALSKHDAEDHEEEDQEALSLSSGRNKTFSESSDALSEVSLTSHDDMVVGESL